MTDATLSAPDGKKFKRKILMPEKKKEAEPKKAPQSQGGQGHPPPKPHPKRNLHLKQGRI